MADPTPDFASRLREALSDSHRIIENLPLAVALTNGAVTREAYVGLVTQLLWLHQTLEGELDLPGPAARLFDESRRRAPTLRRDLTALGADLARLAPPLIETARLQRAFHDWGRFQPWRLAGALYVFEGSRMGSMFIGPAVARALNLAVRPGAGVDYHLDGAAERPQAWRAFKSRLVEAAAATVVQEAIVAGAVETMDGLLALYGALGPLTPGDDRETEEFVGHDARDDDARRGGAVVAAPRVEATSNKAARS